MPRPPATSTWRGRGSCSIPRPTSRIGARGGVRAPRPGDARARAPLRASSTPRASGRPARRVRRRRADRRRRSRSAPGRAETLRRGDRAPARAPRAAVRARRRASGSRWRPRARTRGPTTSTSRSSTRPTTRRLREELRWVAQRNNTWSLHVHVGVRGVDRAVAVCDHLRGVLPHCWRCPRTRRSSTATTPGFTRCGPRSSPAPFPRCGVHEPFGTWDALRRLRGRSRPHRLDRRSDPALVERPPAPRVRHRRAADLRRADARRGVVRARGADRGLHRPERRSTTTTGGWSSRFASGRSRRTSGGRSGTGWTAG